MMREEGTYYMDFFLHLTVSKVYNKLQYYSFEK
jgi:hypothetical protein